MVAVLSWHVQNFVEVSWSESKKKYLWKIVNETVLSVVFVYEPALIALPSTAHTIYKLLTSGSALTKGRGLQHPRGIKNPWLDPGVKYNCNSAYKLDLDIISCSSVMLVLSLWSGFPGFKAVVWIRWDLQKYYYISLMDYLLLLLYYVIKL